jgi:hypothetical protein
VGFRAWCHRRRRQSKRETGISRVLEVTREAWLANRHPALNQESKSGIALAKARAAGVRCEPLREQQE